MIEHYFNSGETCFHLTVFPFTGTVTFIIGFTGCVGALRENTCLLAAVSTWEFDKVLVDYFNCLITSQTSNFNQVSVSLSIKRYLCAEAFVFALAQKYKSVFQLSFCIELKFQTGDGEQLRNHVNTFFINR